MKHKIKSIPHFKNEDQERAFWATHDLTDYFDTSKAIVQPKFPNLKFSTDTISIRLPLSLLTDIKELAHKKDVPYQSLMKIYLADKVREEIARFGK